jgi:tripartite-type tricarboxylate transporter receptor subunit TctC
MKSGWRQRQHRGVAAVAGLALVLAACGGDTDSADDTTADEPAGDDATADDAAEEPMEGGDQPLEGELITFLVGTSPGGGFDAYARLIAPYLAEELGADVTVENRPGAGGLLQLNTLWTAEPDGTTIGIVNGAGVIGTELGGAPGIEYDLENFSWLGRLAGEDRLLSINPDLPYESASELVGLEEPFRFSATGPGGGTFNDGALSCEVFEMTDCDVVTGFDGSEESRLAVTAGEVSGIVTTADSVLGDVNAGDHRAMALVANEEVEDFPGVPTYADIEGLSEEGVEIAEAMVAIAEAGRSLAAPPDMDDELLNYLVQAIENVLTSEEFLAAAEEQDRPIGYQPPDEYLEVVRTALNAPDVVAEVLAEGVE